MNNPDEEPQYEHHCRECGEAFTSRWSVKSLCDECERNEREIVAAERIAFDDMEF